MNKADKLLYLQQANKSTIHYGQAFIPQAFTHSFCPVIHYPMMEVIDHPSMDPKAVAAPRGCGKSTLGNTANILRRATMRKSMYILIVSYIADQACEHLAVIKRQIESNEKIIEVFGELKGSKWSEDVVILKNGVKIKAIGSGQQVRGRRGEDFDRPDYVLEDDFEAEESVQSETILQRLINWRESDLRYSMDKVTGQEVNLGTVLSERAMLQADLNDPDVMSCRLELFDENYQSHWPDVYSNEKIQAMKRRAEEKGTLDKFWADMRNIPIATVNRKFRQDMFRYWDKDLPWMAYPRFIIVDPAKTTKLTSDYSAVMSVALPFWGDAYILDYDMDRQVNDELYSMIARQCIKWSINYVIVETNGLGDFVTKPLENFLRRCGIIAYVEGVHAVAGKEDRIRGLIPLYMKGQIYHSPDKHDEQEGQLLAFPKGSYDDVIDVESYILKIQSDRNMGRAIDREDLYVGDTALLSGSYI